MKHLSYKIIFLLSICLMTVSCGNTKKNNEEDIHGHEEEDHDQIEEVMLTAQQFDALNMKIDTLSRRSMSGYVEANGQLEVPPQNEASITSVVGANVVSIQVIEGDKVQKGQIVAFLSHPRIIQMQTDYLNAYSNSNYLNKDYERQKKLYEAGVGSGMSYQKAEAKYDASKSLVKGMEAQLRLLDLDPAGVRQGTIYQKVALRSPIEGFVQKVRAKTGQYVAPETELFEIVNTHHVHADLMVFEKDVNKVKVGQTVRFQLQSLPDQEFKAIIYSVGKSFEDNPKAIHSHADIENKRGNLIPGMYIQGKIIVDSTKSQALPESAIVKDGDKFFVFSVEKEKEDWSFKPIKVFKGIEDDGWTAVTFPLNIASGTQFAQNNAYYLLAEMKKGEAEHPH
ncbi:efflux RND transporter periplasmic adaptor subunit [Flavobacteriaceae bacterium F89]|uniref:Efflux RND transporter periplasmic adaptor subunit n=1 Tax=Cerina litoralis TaxID=2874477 RepID=A0AAE3ETU6_9FLAO|nr:efflux RND transporter periplasmic adaptor subunit [Cerina litoralis]MCG2460992.1 efflux RND transporter periplasmic adaptor subunit [Cerina litoralis]